MNNLKLGHDYPASMALYTKTNEKVEKVTELIYLVVVKVTPVCVVFPKFLASLNLYLTTDLGNDALELPLPMWFVCYLMIPSNQNSIEISFLPFQTEGFHSNPKI